jgi:hypothetical protein
MPSEFGGEPMKNRVQPRPHVPTASEELMLAYTTGDPTGVSDPDAGEAFVGLLPFGEQLALRESEGVLATDAETLFEQPE